MINYLSDIRKNSAISKFLSLLNVKLKLQSLNYVVSLFIYIDARAVAQEGEAVATNKEDKRNKINLISHVGFSLFTNVSLLVLKVFS